MFETTYPVESFSDRMAVFTAMAPDWSPRRVCEWLHLAGLRRIEWATNYPVGDLPVAGPWHLDVTPRTGNVESLRDLGKEFGLSVTCLSGTPSVRDEKLANWLLDAAVTLDCSMVRLGVDGFHEQHPGRQGCKRAAAALGRWLPKARDLGIKLLVEIHADNVTCSPELARRVVEGFASDDVGIILDPGNMVVQGMAPWKLTAELLGEYLAHVHVKNLGWFCDATKHWHFDYTSLDAGIVDWLEVVRVLEESGYSGIYSFEDFRGGYCCRPVGITTEAKLNADVQFLGGAIEAQRRVLTGSSK